MATPEHERREIERYVRSQSGPDIEIEHLEKLASEYVLGTQYDVWDAHTDEGRWWVITNPTNLYSQQQIKSMDVALSFHIGLWERTQGREERDLMNTDRRVHALSRRLDVAVESLGRAKEVEDFQAVGMRLRELLLTLTFSLSELIQTSEDSAALLKDADFKGLADIYARSVAGGKSSAELRSLLRATSAETWKYVSRLTHARNACVQDAEIARIATQAIMEMFLKAVVRVQRGIPERCQVCTSYRLTLVRSKGDGSSWVKLCEACGATSAAEVPLVDNRYPDPDDEREPPEGDCVEVDDFGIYLTPSQARSIIDEAQNRTSAEGENDTGDVEYHPAWTNPFAFLLFKDARPFENDTPIDNASLIDSHRIVFNTFAHPSSPGTEFVYRCGEPSCVNAEHAVEVTLPNEHDWHAGIVEQVVFHSSFLELQVGIDGLGVQRVFTKSDVLDRYGLGDASSLAERPVFITDPSADGWVLLVPAARRVDYGRGSPVSGWLHPPNGVNRKRKCPCGSGRNYGACHGE